jgi:DNA-binding Lrp family transcriptional regulator
MNIIGLVEIVLTIVIAILLILRGGDMWRWICCFGKKEKGEEKIENNFEREDREALEEYNKARDEYNEALKKYTNGMKEYNEALKEYTNDMKEYNEKMMEEMQGIKIIFNNIEARNIREIDEKNNLNK